MSNRTILGGIICYFHGHDWRRLTKKDADVPLTLPFGTLMNQIRICRRCGAERIAKQRKTNFNQGET